MFNPFPVELVKYLVFNMSRLGYLSVVVMPKNKHINLSSPNQASIGECSTLVINITAAIFEPRVLGLCVHTSEAHTGSTWSNLVLSDHRARNKKCSGCV
ncbi:hypothetical protein PoB_002063300 [Plakobranchus ocellatus]|uniref:Uncharacterized protein n=1 Tax=Plakobranchus ocellatus TaxID=259542 RepID=A0AAV3ZH52_9GAST|nr:hypothetical protein PoB_002063300 [Plakobranchus ocellatus]